MLKTSAIILLLILGSLAVRLYHIDYHGLSEDETLTLCRVNGVSAMSREDLGITTPLPETFTAQEIHQLKTYNNVVEATIDDSGNAIAYNIMLSYWTKLFGNTNTSLRFMSLIFGMLTVILGYYFCRQLFNERTANIAGLLLCFHPVLVEYGQVARSYVPATFLILLSTYSLYQVSVAKKHTWLHIPLYIVSLILSLLCHYVTIYIFVSHIFLVAIFHSYRKALIQYAIMSVIGFGLFSIWLFNGGLEGKKPMNIERSMWQHNVTVNGEIPTTVSTASEATYQLIMNCVRVFGNDLEPRNGNVAAFLLLILLPAPISFFVFLKVRKSEYFRPVMFVTFPFAMYLVYIIVMIIRTGHSIPFDIRYSTFVMPFACLLLAFGFDRMIHKNRKLVIPAYVLLAVVLGIMVAGIFPGVLRKEKTYSSGDPFAYHNAADFIEKNAAEGDTVVFNNNADAFLTNFYINTKVSCVQKIDAEVLPNEVVILTGTHRKAFDLGMDKY